MKPSARRVQEALEALGLSCRVVEMPASTRTAEEAARAIGCTVAQIAKSIVFEATESGNPVLVIASGVNRVNEKAISASLGETVKRASPDFVRESTGFAIGGVPPCGHSQAVCTFIDRDLLDLESIWAAAGTPHAVFRIDAADLVRLTGGRVVDIS